MESVHESIPMGGDISLMGLKQKEPVYEVPVDRILGDPVFNARGFIPQSDIVELARDIVKNGLLQPITVQPYHVVPGFEWRVIVGHRRLEAFKYNETKTIPATIKRNLSETDAHVMNFVENVNRKDLNILQEANGLKWFLDQGITPADTAKKVQKPKAWVDIRYLLLTFPEEIQQKAAAGFISQEQIKDLALIHNRDDQFAAVRRILDARISGNKIPPARKKKSDPLKRKRRDYFEIGFMLGHIYDTLGPNIATRALAWANGDVSDVDLYRELKEFAKEHEMEYEPPAEAKRYITI